MKFRRWHPSFVTLRDDEEKEFQKWHDVNGIVDCMKLVFPAGPYMVYHGGMPEEKVACLSNGHKYFIESRDTEFACDKSVHYLMDYTPDGKYWVLGFVDGDGDGKTVEWDENREEWRITDGLPEKRC